MCVCIYIQRERERAGVLAAGSLYASAVRREAGDHTVMAKSRGKQMLLSRAVHQESSCPAHAHRDRASCLPDSTPYGRDDLARSRCFSTARRALRVA